MLGYSGVKNGGFLSKLGAARMFGLVDEAGGMLRPTQLASNIYAPVQASDAQRAKAQAFLNVELFEKVYERFKGQPLPTNEGLENLLRIGFKVVPAQVKNAIRTMHESAESAGFFNAAGRGRLVLPLAANSKSSTPSAASGVASGGVSGAQTPSLPPLPMPSATRRSEQDLSIPPAIYGLIRDLPPEGTGMSAAKRQRLINAFEASINWLYPDDSEEVANE
jgi:hypothetical protein